MKTKITLEQAKRETDGEMSVCPFCGDVPTVEPWHGGGPRKIMIHCESERCLVSPQVTGETPDEALSAWNHRVPSYETRRRRLAQKRGSKWIYFNRNSDAKKSDPWDGEAIVILSVQSARPLTMRAELEQPRRLKFKNGRDADNIRTVHYSELW
jgi:RNA polymerase subunit RPABC4/transcription elongation factor Spt4